MEVTVIKRTPHSVELAFGSSDNVEPEKGRFYKVINSMGTIFKTSNVFLLSGLTPYRREIWEVRSCHEEGYCESSTTIEVLSDVDGELDSFARPNRRIYT